ncbi:SusD family protein [Xylanibacter oryzae DSM 17970]|uniref:SusD family protein n=1 Tax=Xylanibacter oryzae DSM 17970 TaxID=915438 RepID=A0ABN0RU84_9BACT|nr:RagB/SusD family nutrient uptake outer membrane protein [Xylanibacter oryzae]EXG77793.1 SusD family protein [Xylanibacter oryzae DSM 17970]
MKNLNKAYIVAGSFAIFAFTSCNNDNFLDVTQYDKDPSHILYETDANAISGMNGVYDLMQPDEDGNGDGDWGFKPNLFTGCHPTMDTQATAWDKNWNIQKWGPDSKELLDGWKQCYMGISRANDFLAGLETADKLTPSVKTTLEGEGRAARAFFYNWLATTFGRVPMLATGETYQNTPQKARAKTYQDMWDFIIADLEAAVPLLDWTPLNSQYGRCTKGMALTYLGDAYMWKAYRCPETQKESITKAAAAYKQVLDKGPYQLNRSFTTLWDVNGVWDKEAIWEEVLDAGSDWGTNDNSKRTSTMFTKYYSACPENGGWGSLFLSWEWYSSYEKGDKRRDGSCCTGKIHNAADYESYFPGITQSPTYGRNPYTQQNVGNGTADSKTLNFHFYNGEYAPSIWSIKFWRNARAGWDGDTWCPTQIYWKRLPNVMLDYAECLFILNGGDDATAWGLIDQLRNRAFGNLEVGHADELKAKYLPGIQSTIKFYADKGQADTKIPTAYPIPFDTTLVNVTPAKDYYTALKAKKGFASEVWKVAVNEERRKEFNCEWCLRPDMQRSGYMADHIEHNYPKRNESDLTNTPWSNRTFDYQDSKMDMPIPSEEIIKNKLCDQNPGY